MANRLQLSIALVLLAAIPACSDDDPAAGGTCAPGAHTTADPDGATAHCAALLGVVCDRAFADCAVEIGFNTLFSSAAECAAALEPSCTAGSNEWYDAPCGASCLAYARTAPCSAFDGPEPQACAEATGSLPLACVATISPGTISDTISAGDPTYDGGHARMYCITFAAGQSVSIQTAAPISGTPLDDSVLHLLDPAGAEIASDDDGGAGLYSLIATTIPAAGQYRIVVRGYSSIRVGDFQLTVATY